MAASASGLPEVPGLEPVLTRDLEPDSICSELGELLRMAASIHDGYGSATFLLERYGSAARNSRLHRAGKQWGQWWDTVYLCDYAAQPPFLRSVNRILVRGESVHELERVIHAGPLRYDRGRRRDEKVMISGALTLLTNAVIAYNTWKLNQVLERLKEVGQTVPSDAILAHESGSEDDPGALLCRPGWVATFLLAGPACDALSRARDTRAPPP